VGDRTWSGKRSLEAQCPTGLNGPATLDVLVEDTVILAVESKCVETFERHEAKFADSYREALAGLHVSWANEHARLVEDPRRYRFLDAAQLVKHYVGLRNTYPKRRVQLVYAYWRPRNATEILACAVHEAELAEFAHRVRDPRVSFQALPYDQLWASWSSPDGPTWLRHHADSLRDRYDVSL
jgi:hypothetical protein